MNLDHPFVNCKWIGAETECQTPVITKRFNLEKPAKASLKITACGFFEAKVNGKPVTDYMFLPVVTDYVERPNSSFAYPTRDEFTHRLY